ncbi:hypothetical protein HY345_01585 [Candidatus Microgenomates bacterium]|nr:hypothetical protein [Candidatus Microgenomates bacterium]
MTERNREIHYEPIEQEPESPVIDHEIRYQGTRIERGKPKRLMIKRGTKTVVIKQPRRIEVGLVYITATDTLLGIPRSLSSKLTPATPPLADFPQITASGQIMRELNVNQKPTRPKRSASALTTHYQVDKKPTRANRMAKSYDTTARTYWGPPTKDHPQVKKKLGKIRAPR